METTENGGNQQTSVNQQEAKKMSNKQMAGIAFGVLALVLLIAFVAQNWRRVGVEFLFWRFQIRLIFLIILSAVLGGILTFSFIAYRNHKKKKKK